ncbi:MAG: DNA translocase FtsK [Rhodothermales bacterium]|nr:DNA translocase FtsK [Rhodothermales bacterium]
MASKSRTTRSKNDSLPLSERRKREVLGLILIVVGFLLCLSILTYSSADDGLARNFSLRDALNPGENRANNALGLVGAYLSNLLVNGFLGYLSLVLPAIGLAWGYALFRDRRYTNLRTVSLLVIAAAFVTATLFGWFSHTLGVELSSFSGAWGDGTAAWMERVFGTIGSITLLAVGAVIVSLLLVDRDIQKSIDRIEEILFEAKESIKDWSVKMRAHRSERRSEFKNKKQERRKEREDILRQTTPAADAKAVAIRPEPIASKGVSAARVYQPEPPLQSLSRQERPRPQQVTRDTQAAPEPEYPAELQIRVVDRVEEERTDRLDRSDDEDAIIRFTMPDLDLLDNADDNALQIDYDELEENKQILLDKLATYNIEIIDINAIVGPTVTLYELTPAPGVKISRITALEDDLAMAMAARGIRMIAPIPGKSAVGVEIPNRHRELVRVRDVIGTAKFDSTDYQLPLVIGKTIEGEIFLKDLVSMPHLLIAGSTGSGKSVGLNTIITGLLYSCPPSSLKFVMIDPKKIELQQYARISDHYIAMPEGSEDPIITDVTQALYTLKSCEKEMEDRYDLLSGAKVRNIKDYNSRYISGKVSGPNARYLPYILVVIDELADLMMTAGKDIEGPIARLAQMARAVGIHLILATQRPSVDVITGLIKANFPARIAYQVATKIDSRTILDQNGAQGLVGNGDLLYQLGSHIIRIQGPFVSMEEIDRLTEFIQDQPGPGPYRLPSIEEDNTITLGSYASGDRDDLFRDAARIIVRSQQGSVSLLQRKLSVGYSRAARIVDQLEDAGIVGPFEGSKARQVLVADEIELDSLFNNRN